MPIIPIKNLINLLKPNERPSSTNPLSAEDEFDANARRSKRGNLWCQLRCGITVAIYKANHPDGLHSWCMTDNGGGKYYSGQHFDIEVAAVASAMLALGYLEGRWNV